MDEAASQVNEEAKNGKKTKSCRPIILLRRNSCSITPIKSSTASKTGGSPCSKTVLNASNITSKSINQFISLGDAVDVKSDKENIPLTAAADCCGTKDIIPIVKTEVIERSVATPWNSHLEEMPVIKPNPICPPKVLLNSICNQTKTKVHEVLSIPTQVVPPGQKHLLQSNSLTVPCPVPVNNAPTNVPVPIFTHTYQPVNQITVPVNNATVNSIMHFGNEQLSNQTNFQCGRYFFSPAVHNSVNQLQMPIQENTRQLFFHPTQPHSLPSDGAMLQTFSNPSYPINTSLQPELGQHASTSHSHLDSIADDSLTNITWLGKMGVNNFMPVPLEKEKKLERNDKRGRPPYSYMALIQFAINSSTTGRMTLRQIYEWIEEKFPYFRTAKPGWKNSIRHNLSLHDLFVREVSSGSKASYWTLRPDLNVRPLTLDSVGSTSSQGPIWSLQSIGHNQKPILPRLPYCSRPYILLPVPLLQNSKDSNTNNAQNRQTLESSDAMDQDVPTSSSLFLDSGLHSDMSYCTPSVASKNFSLFSDSALNLHSDSDAILLKSEKSGDDSCPFLSQANSLEKSSKRSRKEPLKTLNDSLNSSFHFDKEDFTSPPRYQRQLLLKKEDCDSNKPMTVGLSEESFTELLNDLGSPFKSYLTQDSNRNKISSPKGNLVRKRRRSWGSPESSGSGLEFQRKLKDANERTPRQYMRRVKSEMIDLTRGEDSLPTSTPLLKEKVKKPSNRNPEIWKNFENKENITPTKSFLSAGSSSVHVRIPNPILAPSPILNPQPDANFENNFFEDIIGSVFKTPEKPSAPVRHFDSLTPTRPPFPLPNPSRTSLTAANKSDDESMAMFLSTSPGKQEPLNTSFSKLLDISDDGGRLPGNFPELDLNLSWSNLSNV